MLLFTFRRDSQIIYTSVVRLRDLNFFPFVIFCTIKKICLKFWYFGILKFWLFEVLCKIFAVDSSPEVKVFEWESGSHLRVNFKPNSLLTPSKIHNFWLKIHPLDLSSSVWSPNLCESSWIIANGPFYDYWVAVDYLRL